ncbi:hypothetical protein F2Q70_00023115 [Brassica cretica]|uniref:Uncharacterized protein n=1 Tax=Brassica cretica TaxID=69181 RepID=A0A8S9GRT8_BRACR|nr:hypothetical protein F2Q70_00023115 [Brassica cretica]
MAPKRLMSIIQGHTSNAKGWFKRFFYVRIDRASVEENCHPLFRGKWNFHRANSVVPAIPMDLFAKSDLLCNGPFFWDSFPLDRIQNAVALYRSRGISRPLRASDMDEPHPDAVPDQGERVRPRKDKGIALEDRNFVSEDLPLPGWNPGFTPGDGSGTSEAPLPDDFFANLLSDFTTPASLDKALRREVVAEGSWLINEAECGRLLFECAMALQGHLTMTGFRARSRFTFGSKAMRRLIGFRFAAYVPLSGIKPSRSSACCCGCSYSLDGIVPVTSAVGASVGSTTVSGVGMSSGKAMDSGPMSLSGVIAWSDYRCSVWSWEFDAKVMDGLSSTAKSMIFVTSLAITGSLIDPRVIDVAPKKPGIAEDDVDCASRVDKDPSHFQLSDYQIDNQWVAVSLLSISFDRQDRNAIELRSPDDHAHPLTVAIVSSVILPPSAFLARLIFAGVVFGELFISFGRAIVIQEEVIYACDLRNFAGEELRSKPSAENLAVHSGMTSGLVELVVGIILELVPGPGISRSLSLFGVDSVIMLALLASRLAGSGTCPGFDSRSP